MDKIQKPTRDIQNFDIDMSAQKKSSKDMITAKQIEKSFAQKNLFKSLDFKVLRGEKVCLIGENGTGKTTILKGILGEVKMDKGVLSVSESATIGYLAQDIVFNNQISLVDYVCQQANLVIAEARNLLAKYGFKGEDVFRRLTTLSGGEKSRIILMLFSQNKYNLMLLDEPTNHLDIQSKEKLEDELEMFAATTFFISHDRYFINRIATRILWLYQGKIYSFDGNYDTFLKAHRPYILKAKKVEKSHTIKPKKDKPARNNNQVELEHIEHELNKIEEEINVLEAKCQRDHTDYQTLMKHTKEIEALTKIYDALMQSWLNQQEG